MGLARGTDLGPDDDRSSTTWYESAGFDSASVNSHSSYRTARADSQTAASVSARAADDGFDTPRSTGSFVSAASGSFRSVSSFKTTASKVSDAASVGVGQVLPTVAGAPSGSADETNSRSEAALQSALYRSAGSDPTS